MYHLRPVSGSSGPIAKEESPLLGWRPILVFAISISAVTFVLPVFLAFAAAARNLDQHLRPEDFRFSHSIN